MQPRQVRPEQLPALRMEIEGPDGCCFNGHFESRFTAPQSLLHPFAFRKIDGEPNAIRFRPGQQPPRNQNRQPAPVRTVYKLFLVRLTRAMLANFSPRFIVPGHQLRLGNILQVDNPGTDFVGSASDQGAESSISFDDLAGRVPEDGRDEVGIEQPAKFCLALAQLLLGFPQIVNVGRRAVPLYDAAAGVALGNAAAQIPAVYAVEAFQSVFYLVWLPGPECMLGTLHR